MLLAAIVYGSGGVSYNYLPKLFVVCPATIYNWVNKYADDWKEFANVLPSKRHVIGKKSIQFLLREIIQIHAIIWDVSIEKLKSYLKQKKPLIELFCYGTTYEKIIHYLFSLIELCPFLVYGGFGHAAYL